MLPTSSPAGAGSGQPGADAGACTEAGAGLLMSSGWPAGWLAHRGHAGGVQVEALAAAGALPVVPLHMAVAAAGVAAARAAGPGQGSASQPASQPATSGTCCCRTAPACLTRPTRHKPGEQQHTPKRAQLGGVTMAALPRAAACSQAAAAPQGT
jgi:hypothetical protein